MNEAWQKLAREAVEKLHSMSCKTREDEKSIILAAIEKALHVERPRIHNKKMLAAIEAVVIEHSGNGELAADVVKYLSSQPRFKVGERVKTSPDSEYFYEVAELRQFPHGLMIGIYDEPPSRHIDYWKPESLSKVAQLDERREGHSALRVKDGKLEKFDPHPASDQPRPSVTLTPHECAEQFRMYARSNKDKPDVVHQLNFCADFLDEFCQPRPTDELEWRDLRADEQPQIGDRVRIGPSWGIWQDGDQPILTGKWQRFEPRPSGQEQTNVMGRTQGISEATSESAINAACFPATSENKTNRVQAPTSHPRPSGQEWTEGKVFAYFESEDFKGLARDINAALAAEKRITFAAQQAALKEGIRSGEFERELAAERERYKMALSDSQRRGEQLDELTKQLAVEQEKLSVREEWLEQLRGYLKTAEQQLAAKDESLDLADARHEQDQNALLAAQAAIAKALKIALTGIKEGNTCSASLIYRTLENVNLTALREHDIELQGALIKECQRLTEERDSAREAVLQAQAAIAEVADDIAGTISPEALAKHDCMITTPEVLMKAHKTNVKIADDALAKAGKAI
jgi:hypothetical protein